MKLGNIMAASEGFVSVTFQLPAPAMAKLEDEVRRLGMKKTEFLTRMVVMYFLARELGMAKDIFDYFMTHK